MTTGFCSSNTCLVLNRRSDSIFRHFPSSYPTSGSTRKRIAKLLILASHLPIHVFGLVVYRALCCS
ncbi:hypothetical protein KY285_023992 [Solanum tuberosum]|nr:hypothetical protein KY289_024340 [Solanum tuberosum]KAH0676191.1 hypothetical protein KY285_023992 [Solanum tuberosum]